MFGSGSRIGNRFVCCVLNGMYFEIPLSRTLTVFSLLRVAAAADVFFCSYVVFSWSTVSVSLT